MPRLKQSTSAIGMRHAIPILHDMEPEPSEVPVPGDQSVSIEPDDLVESVGDMQHGLVVVPNEDVLHKASVTLEQEEPESADIIAVGNSEHQQLGSSEIKVANSPYVVPDPRPSTIVPVAMDSDAGDADKLEAKIQHISIDGAASQGAEIDRDAKMEIERSPVLDLTDSSDGNIEADVGVAQMKEVCTHFSDPRELLQSEEGLEDGETCRVVRGHSHISASSEVPLESSYAGNVAEGRVNAASLIGATESTTATTLAGRHSEGQEDSALVSGSVDDQEPITNPGVAANEENAFAGSVRVLGATEDDEMSGQNLDAPVLDQVETELVEALTKADDSVLNTDTGATMTLDGLAEGFPYVESETSCDDIAVGDLASRSPPIETSMVPVLNAIPQPLEENEDVIAGNQGEMSEEFDRLKAILQPHADAHTANNPASAGEGELSLDSSVDTMDGAETEDQSGGDARSVHRVITENSIAEEEMDGAIGRQALDEGPFSVEERKIRLQEHSTQASTTSIPTEVQEGSHSPLLCELQVEKDAEGGQVNTLQKYDCGTAGQAVEATNVMESQGTVQKAGDADAVEDKEIADSSVIAEASTVSGPKNLAIVDVGDDFVDLEIDKQIETIGERVEMALESQVVTVLDPSEVHKELEAAVTDVNVETDEAEVENGPGNIRIVMRAVNDDKDVEANVDDPSVTENAEEHISVIDVHENSMTDVPANTSEANENADSLDPEADAERASQVVGDLDREALMDAMSRETETLRGEGSVMPVHSIISESQRELVLHDDELVPGNLNTEGEIAALEGSDVIHDGAAAAEHDQVIENVQPNSEDVALRVLESVSEGLHAANAEATIEAVEIKQDAMPEVPPTSIASQLKEYLIENSSSVTALSASQILAMSENTGPEANDENIVLQGEGALTTGIATTPTLSSTESAIARQEPTPQASQEHDVSLAKEDMIADPLSAPTLLTMESDGLADDTGPKPSHVIAELQTIEVVPAPIHPTPAMERAKAACTTTFGTGLEKIALGHEIKSIEEAHISSVAQPTEVIDEAEDSASRDNDGSLALLAGVATAMDDMATPAVPASENEDLTNRSRTETTHENIALRVGDFLPDNASLACGAKWVERAEKDVHDGSTLLRGEGSVGEEFLATQAVPNMPCDETTLAGEPQNHDMRNMSPCGAASTIEEARTFPSVSGLQADEVTEDVVTAPLEETLTSHSEDRFVASATTSPTVLTTQSDIEATKTQPEVYSEESASHGEEGRSQEASAAYPIAIVEPQVEAAKETETESFEESGVSHVEKGLAEGAWGNSLIPGTKNHDVPQKTENESQEAESASPLEELQTEEGPASPIFLPTEVGEVAEESATTALDEENAERTAREEAPATCPDPQEENLKVEAETEPEMRHKEDTLRGEESVCGDVLATGTHAPTKGDEVVAEAVTDPQVGHLSSVNEEDVGVETPSAATVSSTENYQIVEGTALLARDVASRDDEDLRKQAWTRAARADTQTGQDGEETRTKPLEGNNASSADEAMIEEAPDTPAVLAEEKAIATTETGAELLERTAALHDAEFAIPEASGTPADSGKERGQVVGALKTEAHNENPDSLGEGDTSEEASATPSAAFAESHKLVAWVESQPLEENGAPEQRSEESVSCIDHSARREAQPPLSEEQAELVERGEIDELPPDGENVAGQNKEATAEIPLPPTGKVDAESGREGTSSLENSYHVSTSDDVRIDGDEEASDGDAAAESVLHTTEADLSNNVDSATVVSSLENKAEAHMPHGDELVGSHEAAGAETESVMDDEVAAKESEQGSNVSEHVDSAADVRMVTSEGDGSGMIRDNVPINISETGAQGVTIGDDIGAIEQAGSMAIGGVANQVDILEDNHQDAETHDTPGASVEPIPAIGEESGRMAESSGGVERDETLTIPYASNSSLREEGDATCIRENEIDAPRNASKVGRDEVVHSTLAPNPEESFEVETGQHAIFAGEAPLLVSDKPNASVPTSAERRKTEMTLDEKNWERTFAVGAAAKGGSTTITGDSEMSHSVKTASGAVNSLSERNTSIKTESTFALVDKIEDFEVRHVGLAMRAESADRVALAVSPISNISTSNVKRRFTGQETVPTDEAESGVLTREKALVVENDAGESHFAPVSEQVSKAASAATTEERVSQQPIMESGYQPSVDSVKEEEWTGAISSEGIGNFEATQRGRAGKGENESAVPAAGGDPGHMFGRRHADALTGDSAEENEEEDALPANEDETIADTAAGKHDEIAESQREIFEVSPGHIALESETPEEDALSDADKIVNRPQPGEANVLAEAQAVEVYEERGSPGEVIAEAAVDEPYLSTADEMISKNDTSAMPLLTVVHEPGVGAEETTTATDSTARENASPAEAEAETTEEAPGAEINENAPAPTAPTVEGSYVMQTSAAQDTEALREKIEDQEEIVVPVERLQPRLLHEATNEGLPFDVQTSNVASNEDEDVQEDRNTDAKNIKSEGHSSDCNPADAIENNQLAKSTNFSDANTEIRSGEAMSEEVRALPQVPAEEFVQATQEIKFEGTEENFSTRVGAPLFEGTPPTIPPQTLESIAVAEDTEVHPSEKEAVSQEDEAVTDAAISVPAAPIVEGPEVEEETDPGVNDENAESAYTEDVNDDINAWPTTRALETTDVACTANLELEAHERDAAIFDGTSIAEESPDLPALPREEHAKDVVVRDAGSMRNEILIARDVPSNECDAVVEPHEEEIATRIEGAVGGGSASVHVACRSESNEVWTETEAIPLQEGDSLHGENAVGEGTPTTLDAGESSLQCTDEVVMSRVEEPHGEQAFSTAEAQDVDTTHVAENDAGEGTGEFTASHVAEEMNELTSPLSGEAAEASLQAAKTGAFEQRSEESVSCIDQSARREAQPPLSEEQAELVERGEIGELPPDGENVAGQNKEATAEIPLPPTGKVDAESSREGTSSLENIYHVSTSDDVRIDGDEEASDGDAADGSALDATDHVVSLGMIQESNYHGAETLGTALVTAKGDAPHAMVGADETAEVPVDSVSALYVRDAAPDSGMGRTSGSENEKVYERTAVEEITIEGRTRAEEVEGSKAVGANAGECPLRDTEDATAIDSPRDVSTAVRGDEVEVANVDGQADVETAATPRPSEGFKTDRPRNALWRRWMATVTSFFGMIFFQVLKLGPRARRGEDVRTDVSKQE
ncbi:unnamed protein product [Chondrus crispus]|uniref:Uncharacterized protein n=1 Tax=Chondrus crispus TaxID=2769 RepID=R7QB49_CHOCR|nr:unnamed protein product [Chondrus crispus]CDF34646.1 unnamed protein product [Chondrus crispus]|eukprot:XP_005714465.1 unnamed protein product [Chondrus crispus]